MQNKKIELLYIASDNNASSGAFLSMVKLCALLKRNYDVNPYIILPCNGDGAQLLEDSGLEYEIIRSEDWIIPINCSFKFYLKKLKKSLKNILAVFKIIQIIKKRKIDIIHINTIFSYVGAFAALFCKKPFVWHIREILSNIDNKIIFESAGYKLIEKASQIVMISDCVNSSYSQIKSPHRKVIYNGIDDNRFFFPKHNIYTNENLKFICVGEIYKQKGQFELIDACAKLKECGINNWNLSVIGRGDINSLQEVINKYNLSNKIELLGYKSNVQDYLRESDIAFIPSYCEPFGRVTVEAMMSGCLVIAANSGASPEIITNKQTGLLFEAKNSNDLCKVIQFAISNKELIKNIAQQGQKFALEKFSAKENAYNVYELYKNILGENQ